MSAWKDGWVHVLEGTPASETNLEGTLPRDPIEGMVRVVARSYCSTAIHSTRSTARITKSREARTATQDTVPDRLEVNERDLEARNCLGQGLKTCKVFLFECITRGA